MFIIFLGFIILMIILTISKNYYKYEYFAVMNKCNNKDIFKSINDVSKDINELQYTVKNELDKSDKYNEMYKWYLNSIGSSKNIPKCGSISKRDVAKANSSTNQAIASSFKKIKDPKPKTKAAAKNRNMLNNALDDANNNLSENEIRNQWVSMVSGKAINKYSKEQDIKCPNSKKAWEYGLLEKCVNGKIRFNKKSEDEMEEKKKLEEILDDDITVNNCTKLFNKCNVIIDNSKEKTLKDSYKFTIAQLQESVKNMKKKSMGKDIKKQKIPKEFV